MAPAEESPWPVLVGRRVTLRVLTLDDADTWRDGDDAEQQRWFGAAGPAPRQNVVRAITEWRAAWASSGPKRQWGIWCGDQLAGGIDIDDRGRGAAYVSYVVFPDHRRLGLAVDALTLVTAWAFAVWPILSVVAVIDEQNLASRATVARAGFVLDGPADADEASESGVLLRYVLARPARCSAAGPSTA